jgi:hypothetical protein
MRLNYSIGPAIEGAADIAFDFESWRKIEWQQ